MRHAAIGISVVLLAAIAAFVLLRGAKEPDLRRCFVLREGDLVTHLVIESGEPNASMTVVERRDGKDVEPPTTGPGTLEDGAIELVDGTRLEFDATRLVWPEGSLLAGSVFTASDCPAI